MTDTTVHISTLRIETHRIPPDKRFDYFVPNDGVYFYRVFVDDEILTDRALPFNDNDTVIELSGSSQFPYFGGGGWHISVRRIGDYVVWSLLLEDDIMLSDEWFNDNSKLPLMFDFQTYKATVDAVSQPEHRYVSPTYATSSLPELNYRDLRSIVEDDLPDPETALYRDPKRENDKRGAFIMRRMLNVLKSLSGKETVAICNPLSQWTELRIGLDVPDFDESIWRFGYVDDSLAVQLVKNPRFPLWFSHPLFDKTFSSEPFLQSLNSNEDDS